MATEDHKQLLESLLELERLRKYNRIADFVPYAKQSEFFDYGLTKRERLLMAGNQLGKSEAGAVETSYHLTGLYPEDWLGRRFDRPIRAWAAGVSGVATRDIQQSKLCGPPGVEGGLGTGYVPQAAFYDKPSLARGVTDAYDTIQVQWHRDGVAVPGAVSTLSFKSYEQGREKFQGEPVDWIWCDEEPPMDVYSEILTRISATKGSVIVTFTPLKGRSEVVIRYMDEASPDRVVVVMTIYDVGHYTKEERDTIIAGFPSHQRQARANGVPMMGEGRIFEYSDEAISEPALEYVPLHWVKLWGIDFGIGHPFAAVLILWDKDNDVIHVHSTVRVADQLPLQHAVPMKRIAGNVPVAWPQDGTQRRDDGLPLANQYKTQKLRMRPSHATHPDGSISTEAGILEMQNRMTTGRLKVASHLSDWFSEYRMYHRKDGLIVKLADDLMSATRIAIMDRRYAVATPLGPGGVVPRRNDGLASGLDFPLF